MHRQVKSLNMFHHGKPDWDSFSWIPIQITVKSSFSKDIPSIDVFSPDSDDDDDPATTTQVAGLFYDESLVSSDDNETIAPHGAIDEFQAINYEENKNTCVVLARSRNEAKERPILKSTPTENCTQPRHVLCETNTLVVQSFQYECLKKPNTFDLPALISDELTHELCLAVCQELQTKFAVIQMNKCYCLQGSSPTSVNISTDFAEYRRSTCGNVCAGRHVVFDRLLNEG